MTFVAVEFVLSRSNGRDWDLAITDPRSGRVILKNDASESCERRNDVSVGKWVWVGGRNETERVTLTIVDGVRKLQVVRRSFARA